jgi:hypothetical protein
MPNLIVRPENPFTGNQKEALFLPAEREPFARTLAAPRASLALSSVQPAEGSYPAQVPGSPAKTLGPIVVTQEEPVSAWRVDTIAVSPLAAVWLDDPAQNRYLARRRGVVIKNHDPALGIWIRHLGLGVNVGGYLGPGESIALPLGSRCQVYCLGINAAGGNISFYQFGAYIREQ